MSKELRYTYTTETARSSVPCITSWSRSALARSPTRFCLSAASLAWEPAITRLPWNQLTYEPAQGGYVVDLTKEQLEGAPTYSDANAPRWNDPTYSRGIDDYYASVGGRR
jgi:hypothetical protein